MLVLQVGLHRLSAMLACVMSGLAKPDVLVESGYISGGPSLVDDGGMFSSATFFAQTQPSLLSEVRA